MRPPQGSRPALLTGRHPELGQIFAAVDPSVRFTTPGLRPSRLGAKLAPYRALEDARLALEAAGVAEIEMQS